MPEQYQDSVPNFSVYNKINKSRLLTKVEKNGIIRLENQDLSGFKKDKSYVYIVDINPLYVDGYELCKELKSQYNLIFLQKTIAEDIDTFMKWFSLTTANENSIIIDVSGKDSIITEKTEVVKNTSTLVLVKNKTFIPITSENITDINVTVYATNITKNIINKAKISFIAFKDKESGLIKTSEASNDITLIIGSQIINSIDVELNDDNTGIQIAVVLNSDGYIWSSMKESTIIEA